MTLELNKIKVSFLVTTRKRKGKIKSVISVLLIVHKSFPLKYI